jgi:hypothetical protein
MIPPVVIFYNSGLFRKLFGDTMRIRRQCCNERLKVSAMGTTNWNPAPLLRLSGSSRETYALHAGVKLDLFSHLADGSCAAIELSKKLELDARSLIMLLDALVALQLLEKQGDGYYVPESFSAFLNRKSPGYLGHIIIHHHHLVEGWSRLDEVVRSGAPMRPRASHEPTGQRPLIRYILSGR